MIRWSFEPPSRVSLHFGQDQNLAVHTPFKQGRHSQDIESKAAFASRQHIALSILDIVDLATDTTPSATPRVLQSSIAHLSFAASSCDNAHSHPINVQSPTPR
jgi:hypothetical protein